MITAAARAVLAAGLVWQAVSPGVWLSDTPMASEGPLAVVRAIAVRVDPSRVSFALERASRDYGLSADWSIDRLPPSGLVAFNAGQFSGAAPWGWLVRDGVESQPPGSGSLGMSFVVDEGGQVSLVMPGELAAARTRARLAFQSYPALLVDGEFPWELRAPGRGVDLAHRDSRLALGLLADGSVVAVLTRFDAVGRAGETMPWGPTVPEMAAFMKSIGCDRAMLLDGGLSGQLAMRRSDGTVARWSNWRAVPMGLVVSPRAR